MSHTNQSRFWSNIAERWRVLSKDDLPETDNSLIEVGPDDLDDMDDEIDEILGDLGIEI